MLNHFSLSMRTRGTYGWRFCTIVVLSTLYRVLLHNFIVLKFYSCTPFQSIKYTCPCKHTITLYMQYTNRTWLDLSQPYLPHSPSMQINNLPVWWKRHAPRKFFSYAIGKNLGIWQSKQTINGQKLTNTELQQFFFWSKTSKNFHFFFL